MPQKTSETDTQKQQENLKSTKEVYTQGQPKFEGWLCEGVDVPSDLYTVKPINPKTQFKTGEQIWIAGRYSGWEGEKNLTFIIYKPDGTTEKQKRFYMTAGDQEHNGLSKIHTTGAGRVIIKMDETGEVLATLDFEIIP